jgi:hypothetical protein
VTAHGGCRPVGGTHNLKKRYPASSGTYIPGPPQQKDMARAIALPPFSGGTPAEIRALVRRLHQETLPDWSGSTFSVWGGDPNDVIGAAAESVFRLQRRYGGGLGGVLPWGTTPGTELAVGPLPVKKGFKVLRNALRNRRNLGGNDLPAALRVTAERISTLPADVVPVIWVPTDGIEPVTAATHAAVDDLPPGSVHMVVIDPLHGCTPDMEEAWRSVAFGSITRIDDLSVKNVATTIAQLCADALGLTLGAVAHATSTK